MPVPANLSSTAFLIADAARAAMLTALVDGSARPASELAQGAGVTPQTASSHLAKLVAGGLLTVEPEGRHRYYRLAGAQVAQALESLAAITPGQAPTLKPATRAPEALRFARCCYDHLAGELGVALTQALRDRDFLRTGDGKAFVVTEAGAAWFDRLGVDMAALEPSRHGLARQCLDWTERRHHLAGPLGVRLLGVLHEKGWVRRSEASRVITVTPRGWLGLRQELGLDRQDFASLMRPLRPSGLAGPAPGSSRARPIRIGHRSTAET